MKRFIKPLFILLALAAITDRPMFAQELSDDILFRRHIINSGINGLFYGIALDYVADIEGAAAAGIPVITAGGMAVLPFLTNPSRTITSNQMMLTNHGRTLGWAYGFSLATLVLGENSFGDSVKSTNSKITVGLAALTSIGLGIVGNAFGKKSDWSEGRTALFRHYGWVGPITGFSLAASFTDDPRLLAGSILLGGAGGYFLANNTSNRHEFKYGEVRAVQTMTVMNLGLSIGLLTEKNDVDEYASTDWLYPAAGVVSGTIIGQLWVKNTNMTLRQGLNTAYATAGGAVLGLGIALLTGSDNSTPYYLIPYATGMGAYAFSVERIRRINKSAAFIPEQKAGRNWNIAFLPQNLLLNDKIQKKGFIMNGKYTGMQPLFSASVVF